ncbi:hypothetical protein [Microbacterium sp. XT11]|uniref:hypothetical protein n=1 Tax=Microbacterium sp. XT11 TaxID=367477 RepID=UPI00074310A9|nr:hypothetical protein [Microbacterium sp. XT11]ALX67110.1 hypothetical protein AB663_002813 [Microbacterium sp. XT11]
MSTSDQQGRGPLTRKQLREIRLTGATPVITAEEAAAAAPPAPPVPPLPRPAQPVEVAPVPARDTDVDVRAVPLTRRQAREQERIKTASVPVLGGDGAPTSATDAAPSIEDADAPVVPEAPQAAPHGADGASESAADAAEPELVSAVPEFPTVAETADEDADDEPDEPVDIVPLSASAAADTVGDVPLAPDASEDVADEQEGANPVAGAPGVESAEATASDEEHDASGPAEDEVVETGERPTVSPTFGSGVLSDSAVPASTPSSFDDILGAGDSAGSHVASNTLIFNPPPGEGSLSGPVASTGEILVTGSYELPQGLGSQGHAHGTADGKEVDAVLIDGELPPASSPTPIAASSAVSTIKPAGEVIRPPAPEKGNRLMLILAIVAGGLALALGVVLVVAFTTNVL